MSDFSMNNSSDKNSSVSDKKEESSIYSDACSNSLEIKLLNKNKENKILNENEKNNSIKIEQDNLATKYEIENNLNKNYNYILDYSTQFQPKNNNKYSFQNDNNILSSNSSFSITDTSLNNRPSGLSFNSTKSSLLSKIKIKNLKKIKIDFPKKGYLNNRYLVGNQQILTPIEEKEKGTFNYTPSILSCENKKKKIALEDKGCVFMRQTLDPKIKKFLFSPKDINNINNIQEIKNDKKSENNESNKCSKNTYGKKINKKYVIDSDKEDNENVNLNDIAINEFNYKTQSMEKNKKRNKSENKIKYSTSFKIGNESSFNTNYSFKIKRSPSLNSTLNVKKVLKFDKLSQIDINNIKLDEIDLNFLKKKLRTIPVKVNKIPNLKNRYIKTLIEIQNFFIEDSAIWVMKISHNYEYLATGSKNGFIKIFSILGYNSEDIEFIYNKEHFINYLKLISENPILELKKHSKDIIDLSWSPFNFNLLLSASLDHYVILWDISKKKNNILKKFDHNEIITCISFSPTNPNIFISGCFDRFIRIFNIEDSIIYNNENIENKLYNENDNCIDIKKKKNNLLNDTISTINVNRNKEENLNINNIDEQKNLPNYFNINEIITSVAFFPEGNKVAIGTHNGKVLVYSIFPKICYLYNFFCRNKLGKFSSGKKITSIDFTDKKNALITTSDSRIRYISMIDGKILCKYKGHANLNSMIRSGLDLCNDILISGSEDNFCYIWSLFNKENKMIKNYSYEYFKPFARENIYCSLVVPEFCYVDYIKKIYKYTTKINIISVIINATDNGRLEVLLNVDDN